MIIGDDIKTIWIASVPRTGSMWTFNVTRDIVRASGRPVLPEVVPHADEEMEALGRAGLSEPGPGIHVVKVHTRIPADLPNSCFIVTRRDLRDSVVSFMRFTRSDFDAGLYFLASAVRLQRHFATFPAERAIVVEYGDIVAEPAAVIAKLAGRLGVDIGVADVTAIVARYSKANVQARLVEREQALREKISQRRPVAVEEFVRAADSSLRAFDVTTGFQSGHVSDYREGDWRHILSASQKSAIEEIIANETSRPAAEG